MKKKTLLPLVKQSDLFKLVIPESVERKIRFLCNNIWNTEWSGVLFYKVEGSFEEKSLVITCVDIFQMDEGSTTYTEFNMSPEVCTYICNHPELTQEGVYQGLIHSHNNMATFMSGTDLSTLQEEGNDMNHFVSLIVNNAGNYTAAVTRKIKVVKSITEDYSYNTWGGKECLGKANYISEEECIEYYYLNIDKYTNSFEEEMLQRLTEIRDTKKSNNNHEGSSYFNSSSNHLIPYTDRLEENTTSKELKQPISTYLEEYDSEAPYGKFHADKDEVEDLVKQIVTSSVIIPNNSKIDIRKWANSMPKLYTDRFGDDKTFEEFAINYVDFLINNAEFTTDYNQWGSAILASDIVEELKKLPENKWINIYISILNDYII